MMKFMMKFTYIDYQYKIKTIDYSFVFVGNDFGISFSDPNLAYSMRNKSLN